MNSSDLRRKPGAGLWTVTGVAATFLTPAAAAVLGIPGIEKTEKVTKTKVHKQVMALWGDGPNREVETGLRVIVGKNDEGRTVLTVDVEEPADPDQLKLDLEAA